MNELYFLSDGSTDCLILVRHTSVEEEKERESKGGIRVCEKRGLGGRESIHTLITYREDNIAWKQLSLNKLLLTCTGKAVRPYLH